MYEVLTSLAGMLGGVLGARSIFHASRGDYYRKSTPAAPAPLPVDGGPAQETGGAPPLSLRPARPGAMLHFPPDVGMAHGVQAKRTDIAFQRPSSAAMGASVPVAAIASMEGKGSLPVR